MKSFAARATPIALLFALATAPALASNFSLSVSGIKNGQPIAAENYWNNFGCSGGNIMPKLDWKNAPAGTRSFAVTFYDKDAPTGSGFWHWVAYNIPADAQGLAGGANGGSLPAGAVEGNTDLGKPGFFGPCPPVGRKHHYVWTVHALKTDALPVDKGASPALVGFYLWQNRLGEASVTVIAGPRK